ncbi:MAG TPA: diguanylate cyclase [Anaeromyxobacteraceae bacterium]|nr:diguanylate cyclase [Anaeromyxobacteraceae bacterium]
MRVLVADDSPTVRALVSAALKRSDIEVVEACDGGEAWERLQAADAPRLALLDWEMPRLDGVDVCRRIRDREAGGTAYTYVLLLTARGGRDNVIAGMEAGADDYVVKPFDEHELRVRVRAGRRIVELQAELFRLQEMFRLQSRTDPLTGCLNRRAIVERLGAEMSRAKRDGRVLGVAMLDLDHFKRVNDTHGHAAGDEVLRELVRRLGAGTRVSDTFGRVGGEEFLVLWPLAGTEDVSVAAERTRVLVAATPFPVGPGGLAVTASFGVTTTSGAEEPEAVMARADQALYAAKQGGRDRVERR